MTRVWIGRRRCGASSRSASSSRSRARRPPATPKKAISRPGDEHQPVVVGGDQEDRGRRRRRPARPRRSAARCGGGGAPSEAAARAAVSSEYWAPAPARTTKITARPQKRGLVVSVSGMPVAVGCSPDAMIARAKTTSGAGEADDDAAAVGRRARDLHRRPRGEPAGRRSAGRLGRRSSAPESLGVPGESSSSCAMPALCSRAHRTRNDRSVTGEAIAGRESASCAARSSRQVARTCSAAIAPSRRTTGSSPGERDDGRGHAARRDAAVEDQIELGADGGGHGLRRRRPGPRRSGWRWCRRPRRRPWRSPRSRAGDSASAAPIVLPSDR